MQIFNPVDKVIMQLLGEQKRLKDEKIRPLKYTLKLGYGAGCILHNFLTGESIFFKDENDLNLSEEYLFSHYFFVREDNDDYRLTEELRAAVRLINHKKEISSFKILTTSDCNARCLYCYELGMKRIAMSRDVADKAVDYILKNNPCKKTTLAWFGGEPLLNVEAIDRICNKLILAGAEFSSVMTSNGYLFTPELIKKAKEVWCLKNIQITFDGTKDNYNRIKAYTNSDKNPFGRVMENIKNLIFNEIRVNIRLNMSISNFKDLCVLVDYLDEEFPQKDFLSVYASGLFQDTERAENDDKSKELFKCLDILNNHIYSKGLAKRNKKSLKLRASGCMADNDAHRGINPEGKLMKCEHHIFDRLTGDIYNDYEDEEFIKDWKEKMPYEDICMTCTALPTCYRLKNCPVSHICSQEERKLYIDSLKNAIKDSFKK